MSTLHPGASRWGPEKPSWRKRPPPACALKNQQVFDRPQQGAARQAEGQQRQEERNCLVGAGSPLWAGALGRGLRGPEAARNPAVARRGYGEGLGRWTRGGDWWEEEVRRRVWGPYQGG